MVKIPLKVKKQVRAYIKAVETEWKVSAVILFGSYAKGCARKDSDIDLAIISSQFPSPPSMYTLERLQDLKWDTAPDVEPVAIDLISYKNSNVLDFIGGVIRKEGIPAYKKGKFLI